MSLRSSQLVAFLVVVAFWARAQNAPLRPPDSQSPSQQVSQSATQAPPPAATLLKKLVCFMKVQYRDGAQTHEIRGTAFFAFVEDPRLSNHRGFTYLVTNRHMAAPEVEGRKATILKSTLRLNFKDPVSSVRSAELDMPLDAPLHWVLPQDDAVDLAVMPVSLDEAKIDYVSFPSSLFVTDDVVKSEQIVEGDSVLFAGFFYQYPGQQKMEPIVRQGILAMMPAEKLDTTLHKPGHLFLADVHVFGGNSGSPMLVNIGGLRNGRMMSGPSYRLLGVVSGYFYETEDLTLQAATTYTGKTSANSGISIVVPATELKALLDSPELQRDRDAAVARETQK